MLLLQCIVVCAVVNDDLLHQVPAQGLGMGAGMSPPAPILRVKQ